MSSRSGRFTGRHMATILVLGFGVVIGINFLMAHYAVSTFGGVVVENSYVASQDFNRWLDEAAKEKALGWKAQAMRQSDGKLYVRIEQAPSGATLSGDAWHPLGVEDDMALTFDADGHGGYISRESLPAGRWTLRLAVQADGQIWHTEEPLS
ncbi:FixH family protein [Novosphingobium colocasiae]|uniref:Cytochrome oxidase n=1 Tax=Novosphingobium colocasiae TaxID=1256513 RepID=A0A918PA07_9SPHN|nr:FixH family protein [Novosphingobium colocasiae]GGY93514.1 cytochrome oxidase [Novosphingobium colocasiae]